MSVQIIVDSTVDMPERMKDRFRIVPLTVHFGAEEYIDGVTIDKHRFYERLVESDELPTTSQASPAAFDAIFSDVASVGDSAVVVTIASKFSGTYQSACIAAAEYDNIYVVDSKSAAIGSGILAEYALECADKGMDAKTIAETLEKKARRNLPHRAARHARIPQKGRAYLEDCRVCGRTSQHQAGHHRGRRRDSGYR